MEKNKKNNKYVLKNKKRFFAFLFLISLTIFTLIYTSSVSGYRETQYQHVAIEAGDTLWSIAEKYGDNRNIREFIREIKKLNDIDSGVLYANTTILVPVDK